MQAAAQKKPYRVGHIVRFSHPCFGSLKTGYGRVAAIVGDHTVYIGVYLESRYQRLEVPPANISRNLSTGEDIIHE